MDGSFGTSSKYKLYRDSDYVKYQQNYRDLFHKADKSANYPPWFLRWVSRLFFSIQDKSLK